MGKLTKIFLIVLPVIFFIDFFTLANTDITHSPFLLKMGSWIGNISLFSFVLFVLYFIVRGIGGLFHPKEKKIEPPKENNRPFNLIWFVFFGLFIIPNFYYPNSTNSFYSVLPYMFAAVGFFVSLLLIIPRRNNFFSLPLLLIISFVVNFAVIRFYDLTWYFYPNFHVIAAKGGIAEKWLAASSWGVPFLTVMACVYVFLSSSARLIFKKTKAPLCLFIALFLTGFVSYFLFCFLPISFTFPKTEIKERLEPTVMLELIDLPTSPNSKRLTSVPSATSFFMYVTNLQKGKRYGVRILTPEQKVRQEDSVFLYCKVPHCQLEFGGPNNYMDRFKPGIYTIQIIAQEGNRMTITAQTKIEITTLVIKPLDKTTDYPCKLWLTLGESSKKLIRIDASDNQEMTDIHVLAQCSKGKTYNTQTAVGTISNEIQYYQGMSDPTGEPFTIINLGGNVAHGLVRLVVDNQIMGEAIINRGFPICDGEKIVEGGEDINCKKNNK
ncbi:MAG: hypothetical protein V1922_05210 [bacterium]